MDVCELDIDLIDSINPWQTAYAVLARAMNESTLQQVQATISTKLTRITPEEVKEFAKCVPTCPKKAACAHCR